ncbi:aspartate/glutamate racemase family protein [Thalassospira povalilytica]|uniref:arylmalonate decarboxylase n=1 Tax=Thalassospira povalilytica TaxID=732237 RepID=UPI003AA8D217
MANPVPTTPPIFGPPTFGLIVPPREGAVPPEANRIYPDMNFVARGLGLIEMAHQDYDRVIADTTDHAILLAASGVDAISLMGTSLSFFKGPAFNDKLIETLQSATGLPATTMSQAIIDGLALFSARKVAILSAYEDDVNARLCNYLAAYGIRVVNSAGLNIRNIADLPHISGEYLMTRCRELLMKSGDCDTLLVSCGGLRTIDLAPAIEKETGIPVVSSAVAGLWATVNLIPSHTRDQKQRTMFGKLFDQPFPIRPAPTDHDN